MNILEQLWYGDISPTEDEHYRTPEYRQLLLHSQRRQEKLLPTLSDTQKEDVQKLQELEERMQIIRECNSFMTGFRLAVQLMAASMGE